MYVGNPTTQSGQLTMTTISIGSAFESMGNATNGFHSRTFDKFVNSLDGYRQRVENQYRGAIYPRSMVGNSGVAFNPEKGKPSTSTAAT